MRILKAHAYRPPLRHPGCSHPPPRHHNPHPPHRVRPQGAPMSRLLCATTWGLARPTRPAASSSSPKTSSPSAPSNSAEPTTKSLRSRKRNARRGVISYSSGNHAQGVAYAARALKVKSVIVMPNNAPAIKREATAALGAEIVLVGPGSDERKTQSRRTRRPARIHHRPTLQRRKNHRRPRHHRPRNPRRTSRSRSRLRPGRRRRPDQRRRRRHQTDQS